MTMNAKLIIFGILILAPISVLPQATPPSQSQTQQAKKPATATKVSQSQNEGERIFQQNCSRCHNVPNGFSSRISGTVVRHMRVRASLSEHDQQELLRFFNP
jgi:mono/diheme cytochrome c family protein